MIWLEIRVTQGHAFSVEDQHLISEIIEEVMDISAANVYFQSEGNFGWVYIGMEEARLDVNRLKYYQSEVERAFRDQSGQAFDELNIVDHREVERFAPQVVY